MNDKSCHLFWPFLSIYEQRLCSLHRLEVLTMVLPGAAGDCCCAPPKTGQEPEGGQNHQFNREN